MPGSWVLRVPSMLLAAVALVVATTGSAAAHGGGPSLEVVPNRLTAGDSTTVYGDDLSPDVSGILHLLTARGELVVGRATMGPDGHFTQAIHVPGDLPPRIYELRLTDDTGLTFSTFVTVEVAADGEPVLPRLVAAIAGASVAIGALIWVFRSRPRAKPRNTV